LIGMVGDDDIDTFGGEAQSGFTAQSTARTCDESDF